MNKTLKNAVLAIVVIVLFCVRVAGTAAAFDIAFYIGIAAILLTSGIYLLINRKNLDEKERTNEIFYLCAIGVVLICKIFLF